MDSFRSVIDRWPSLAAFANDIDVIYVTAQAMRRRDNIPPEYWNVAVESAARRYIGGISLALLADLASSKRDSKRMKASA